MHGPGPCPTFLGQIGVGPSTRLTAFPERDCRFTNLLRVSRLEEPIWDKRHTFIGFLIIRG